MSSIEKGMGKGKREAKTKELLTSCANLLLFILFRTSAQVILRHGL